MHQQKSLLLALSIVLAMPVPAALAQVGRGAGGIGGRGTIGGARPGSGLSSPRSGLDARSNPIANPSPSLTPHEVLNPRGSLSTGQVLHPEPSLRRPRSGGTMPAARQSVTTGRGMAGGRATGERTTGGSTSRRVRLISGGSTADYFDQLGDQLREFKNGEAWAQYLALPKDASEARKGASQPLGQLLRRFARISSHPAYAEVTALPAFGAALDALKQLVKGTAPGGSKLDPTRRTGGEWILQSAVALDHQLEQHSPAGAWSKRLSLDELRVTVPVLSEQPANAGERKSLERIVKTFQDVAKDTGAADVHQLPDFNETLRALQAYLKSSKPTVPPDLSLSLDQLAEELRDFRNGDSWAEYLALPKALSDDEPTQAAREPTQQLLQRFDKLTSDPTYHPVTALIAFRPAHEALKLAADEADTLPPPKTVAAADEPSVTPADAKPAADKKPVAAADEKPAAVDKILAPVADKEAVAAADKQPAKPPPSAPETTKPGSIDPAESHQSVGGRVLKAAVALKAKLEQVAPDDGWRERLSLADLGVTVSMTSDQPRSDSDRKSLEEIVKTFQEVATSKDDAAVTQLPEFKETLEALQQYLKP